MLYGDTEATLWTLDLRAGERVWTPGLDDPCDSLCAVERDLAWHEGRSAVCEVHGRSPEAAHSPSPPSHPSAD